MASEYVIQTRIKVIYDIAIDRYSDVMCSSDEAIVLLTLFVVVESHFEQC